jgi:hypothetical protein
VSGADNVSRTQFRMHTNIGAQGGSQGTLFQGGHPRAGAGQPWPRGFSPGRRAEVVSAMDSADPDSSYSVRHFMSGSHGRPAAELAPNAYTRADDEQRTRPATAAGVASIARSTVPAEHIRGPRYYFANTSAQMDGNYGTYTHRDSGSSINVLSDPKVAGGTTPIHEIGHHVSAAIDQNPHSAGGGRREHYDHGVEEGYAENYAETHSRDQRGRPLRDFDTSPAKWSGSYGMTGPDDDKYRYGFMPGFQEKRKQSPGVIRRTAAQASAAEYRSPSGINGQLPLLNKHTQQGETNSRGERGPDTHSVGPVNTEWEDKQSRFQSGFPWRGKSVHTMETHLPEEPGAQGTLFRPGGQPVDRHGDLVRTTPTRTSEPALQPSQFDPPRRGDDANIVSEEHIHGQLPLIDRYVNDHGEASTYHYGLPDRYRPAFPWPPRAGAFK